jgi:hypothetical protein
MTSKREIKQRKRAANGNANSPGRSKVVHSHAHGSGDRDEEEEHGHAEASMIWDALKGRGSSVLSKCSRDEGFHPNTRLPTTLQDSPIRTSPEELRSDLPCAGDQGSRAALYGLFANIGLTGLKGAAGWCVTGTTVPYLLSDTFLSDLVRYLNSAALIADAGHSLSGKSYNHSRPTPA